MIPHNVAIADDGAWIMPVRRRALPKRDAALAKITEREQRQARLPTAKADAIVSATLLQKKLGKTTFRLWCSLLTMRDAECETHPSLGGITRASHLSGRNAQRCLAKLRQFGLLVDQGFVYRRVPCKCPSEIGAHVHKVYLRTVYGLLRASPDQQTQSALVPRETARMVKEAASHGGARAGAGRPKGKLDSQPRQTFKCASGNSSVDAYKYQVPISSESLSDSLKKCGVSLRVESIKTRAGKEGRKNPMKHPMPPILTCVFTQQESERVLPTQPEVVAPVPAVTNGPAPAAGAAVLAEVDGEQLDLLDALRSDAKCITFGGGYKGPQQRYTSDDMRAATELSNQIEVLRVPAPPKVQEDHTPEQRLALMRAAYRAVHERVMRADYWRPAGKKQSEAERAAWLEAAEALAAECISPTSWARFAFYQWHRMGKQTAPTPKWVWTAARIHEYASWCHEATGSLSTAAPVPMPAVKALMYKLGELRQKLGWGRPTAVVVSEVLPDAERRVLLAQQAQQREVGQRDIEKRIRDGEWVWG